MAKYRLPDFSPEPAKQSAAEPVSKSWTDRELEQWLAANGAAAWVADWLAQLRQKLGESLPARFQRGLGPVASMPRWMAHAAPDPRWLRRFLMQSDLAPLWFEAGFLQIDPPWLERLIHCEEAKIARGFLITGNISDYGFDPVWGYRPTTRLLIDSLKRIKDCVLTFSLSRGLSVFSVHEDVRERLPKNIRQELNGPCWIGNGSLLTEVCRLFDHINRWLIGDSGAEATEPDSADFTKGVAIVFENVPLIMPPESSELERNFLVDNLLRWSSSPELFRGPHCLMLLAESLQDVGNDLRARGGKIEQINIPRPDRSQARLKFLIPLLDPGSEMKETRVSRLLSGIARLEGYAGTYADRIRHLSHDTAGLSLMGIEDLLQQTSVRPGGVLNRETVMALKRERLRQESDGLIEVINPRQSLADVGGYDQLKKRLRQVTRALKNAGDPLVKATLPMGILFLGPPGTGKSFMASVLAKESGVSMARLGDFRGMYVGQSERNLSRIFSLIESLHPVIVFIDEIDQALGQRGKGSGDGGVDNRIFGKFLEFMSLPEHRGKILWIGASNFPDHIDPAFKRAGRFDLILPFLLPDKDSRREILKVQLKAVKRQIPGLEHRLGSEDFAALAELTEGYSGAELQAIINEVLRRMASGSSAQEPINRAMFEAVLAVYRPPAGQRQRYREMEQLAVREISFIDLIPEEARHLMETEDAPSTNQKGYPL